MQGTTSYELVNAPEDHVGNPYLEPHTTIPQDGIKTHYTPQNSAIMTSHPHGTTHRTYTTDHHKITKWGFHSTQVENP